MPRASKKTTVSRPVAEICLYGTRATGAGWLMKLPEGKPFGREVLAGRTFTEAIWTAVESLRDAGVRAGMVRIFEPEGLRCADVEIAHHVPSFGQLSWRPAPVCVISAEEIAKHAEPAEVSERFLDGHRFRLVELRLADGSGAWRLFDAEATSDAEARARAALPVVDRGSLRQVVEYIGEAGRLEQADPDAMLAEAALS